MRHMSHGYYLFYFPMIWIWNKQWVFVTSKERQIQTKEMDAEWKQKDIGSFFVRPCQISKPFEKAVVEISGIESLTS